MKYTDGLFAFPIRVYDGVSVKRALRQEEDMEISVDGDWVQGVAELPFTEIKGLVDYYSKTRPFDEVAKDGFDLCIVMTNTFGDYVANMSREALKEKLNIFADEYANAIDKMSQEKLEEKRDSVKIEEPKPKSKWWRRNRT